VTAARQVARFGRPLVWACGALPLLWLLGRAVALRLGADPVETIQKVTGLAALSFLLGSLAVTPLRRLTGWGGLILLRRSLGLVAFGYAVLHALSYFVFDQALSPSGIAADVVKHPWVLAGFSAFLLLVPLAVTSTDRMVRRLGGRRWQRLHRLVYVAAILAVLHFLWLVKRDVTLPLYFLVALIILLSARLVPRRRPGTDAPRLAGR
jgi:methionine sulfoxide reductase heme-binding subunit